MVPLVTYGSEVWVMKGDEIDFIANSKGMSAAKANAFINVALTSAHTRLWAGSVSKELYM